MQIFFIKRWVVKYFFTPKKKKWNKSEKFDHSTFFLTGADLLSEHLEKLQHYPSLSMPVFPLRQRIVLAIERPGSSTTCALPPPNPSQETNREALQPSTSCPRKKGRCQVCPAKNDRKTKTVCLQCQKFLCREHSLILCATCHYQP